MWARRGLLAVGAVGSGEKRFSKRFSSKTQDGEETERRDGGVRWSEVRGEEGLAGAPKLVFGGHRCQERGTCEEKRFEKRFDRDARAWNTRGGEKRSGAGAIAAPWRRCHATRCLILTISTRLALPPASVNLAVPIVRGRATKVPTFYLRCTSLYRYALSHKYHIYQNDISK